MRNIKQYFLLLLVISIGCKKNKPIKLSQKEREIINVLHQVDSLLKIDRGNFWGMDLYGPILFVNRKTRAFIANQNNLKRSFSKRGEIFIDTLPKSINIANTAFNWDGIKWTMVMLPLPKDKHIRNNLIIHELFHSKQEKLGFKKLSEANNGHLDTYKGRLLLRLELEALKKALQTKNKDKMRIYLMDAFQFRKIRQESDKVKISENLLELNEGMAEYTSLFLSGRNDNEIKEHLINSIDNFFKTKTFVRSFAYQTIPAYGYLMSKFIGKWHKEINVKSNLIDLFETKMSFSFKKSLDLKDIKNKEQYNYANINDSELEREKKRIINKAKYEKMFLKEPVLKLTFEKMNISFNPNNLFTLDNYGTVYPTLRITDSWGVLIVNEGALLSSNWKNVKVTQPLKISDSLIEGKGWKLELNNTWKLVRSQLGFKVKKI